MLTVEEVAERLRISTKTVKRLIQAGQLAAMKAGTAANSGYRVGEDALADFMERQAVRVQQ